MRIGLRGTAVIAALLIEASLGVIWAGVTSAYADHIPFSSGEVLVSGDPDGSIKRFTPTGTLVEVLDAQNGNLVAGMCFDTSGNLRSTNFSSFNMTLFDSQGGVVQFPWGSGYSGFPESCAVDASGNVYVGQAAFSQDVLKFSPTGVPLAAFDVAPEQANMGGSDWIDLAADQTTLFYTSEGTTIKRFDVSTNTQLPDFATGLGSKCYAMRIRANGEVLAACSSKVVRLSPAGAIIQTYPASNYSLGFLFAFNLDPDGTTFWTADSGTGDVVRVDIATGAQVAGFNAGTQNVVGLIIVPPIPAPDPCAFPPATTLMGTPGPDVILINDSVPRVIDGAGGNDTIVVGNGNNVILGGDGNDTIVAGSGDDLICGGMGDDVLVGGDGNDVVSGEEGNDVMVGNGGDDQLFGGDGDDVLEGGAGNNDNDGGSGSLDVCVNGTSINCP